MIHKEGNKGKNNKKAIKQRVHHHILPEDFLDFLRNFLVINSCCYPNPIAWVMVTGSQNCLGWQGSVEIIQSKPPAKAGPPPRVPSLHQTHTPKWKYCFSDLKFRWNYFKSAGPMGISYKMGFFSSVKRKSLWIKINYTFLCISWHV